MIERNRLIQLSSGVNCISISKSKIKTEIIDALAKGAIKLASSSRRKITGRIAGAC